MHPIAPLLLAALACALPGAARADACGDLTDRVARETGARVQDRRADYATFSADSGIALTFSCGEPHASSAGAQFRGETLPDAFFTLLGRAGQAVTGIEAPRIEAAARQAQDAADRLRHSNVEAAGARVTCSVTGADAKRLTMCAVIARGDRS